MLWRVRSGLRLIVRRGASTGIIKKNQNTPSFRMVTWNLQRKVVAGHAHMVCRLMDFSNIRRWRGETCEFSSMPFPDRRDAMPLFRTIRRKRRRR